MHEAKVKTTASRVSPKFSPQGQGNTKVWPRHRSWGQKVQAIMSPRPNFCLSQSGHEALTALASGIRRYDHITPTLRDTLHWLPISQRITFKTALTMFDCSHGRCPKYFRDVFIPVHTVAGRSRLRSADHGDLVVPRVRSTRFGCRSFRVCGPTIWNELPQDLRSIDSREQFKRSLKSWLFECAYGRRRVW